MKEAMFYNKLKNSMVQCSICPRKCIIKENENGFCRARHNKKGILYSAVYAKLCAANIDPIEKKPLFHFLPGSKSYSVGTAGCNLRCRFCQNWEISQAFPEDIPSINLEPKELVKKAINSGCSSISYTYTEPTIFYEYVLDSAKLAKEKGLKNVSVTNGFISQEPLKELYKFIDAANVDLKGFTDEFYRKNTEAWLAPVLDALKAMHKLGVWIELTNLIVPKLNDDMNSIKKMCEWIKKKLSPDVPLHFSRFFPHYDMNDTSPTPEKTLLKAAETAKKSGLNYIYIGNINIPEYQNTYCPKCSKLVIERKWFDVVKNNLRNGRCKCGGKSPGVWR